MAGIVPGVPVLVISDQTLHKFAKLMLEKASATASDAGATMVEANTFAGEAAEAILQCAEDEGADLIVTGSRGVGDLHSLFSAACPTRWSRIQNVPAWW